MIYNCTDDVLEHKRKVKYWMNRFSESLINRSEIHDISKLIEPEKSMFNFWTPKLKQYEFGSDKYKEALAGMGDGLKHHYKHNRHHPEHYPKGINDMTLIDIVEMVADWMAAAEAKNEFVNLEYLANRFGMSEQLLDIIANQLREEDIWNRLGGVPVSEFCPPHKRKGHIEIGGIEIVENE